MRYVPSPGKVVEADIDKIPPGWKDRQGRLVILVFTNHAEAVAALRTAARLSASSGIRPQVLMLYDVPYTLPLENRALPEGFCEGLLRAVKRDFPEGVALRIRLCRGPLQVLRHIHPSDALIVIGGKRHWWPTRESCLARALRKSGYEVVVVGPGSPEATRAAIYASTQPRHH